MFCPSPLTRVSSPHANAINLKAPQARRCTRPRIITRHPHLPPRLSWMGAMSPSNPVSGIWTPSRPGSLHPPHLPSPGPLFVAPRSRKPRQETAYQRTLLVLIAHLCSSLVSPHSDLSHHGFFKEERRWWCCRRGQEGSIPCCPQGARRRQPVRRSQAPPGYSPSFLHLLIIPAAFS